MIQALGAQLEADLGCADIAGFLDNLQDGESSIGMHIVDYFFGSQAPDAVLAVDPIRGFHHPGVQSAGHDKGFKGTPRLQGVSYHAVSAGFRGITGGQIGVQAGNLGHGQDFAGLGHGHQHQAAGGLPVFHSLLQLLFSNILDGAVNGEDQVVPHDFGVPGLFSRNHDVPPGVQHVDATFRLAVEVLIEQMFEAFQAVAVDVAEAQDGTGQTLLGIIPPGLRDEINGIFVGTLPPFPGRTHPAGGDLFPKPEGLLFFRGEVAFHKNKGPGSGENLVDFQEGKPQDLGQFSANQVSVTDLLGVGHQGVGLGADGQLHPPAVHDEAAHRRDRAVLFDLSIQFFPEFGPTNDLQVDKTAKQHQSKQGQTQTHQDNTQPSPFVKADTHGQFTLTTCPGAGGPISKVAASCSKRAMEVKLENSTRSFLLSSICCLLISRAWAI